MQKAQQLKHALGDPVTQENRPKSPTVIDNLVEIISSPSCPTRQQEKPGVEEVRVVPQVKPEVEEVHVVPPRAIARPGSSRSLIASANLESAITDAIRKRAPGCESFVGVIVQPTRPKSRFDANWAVRGVKFGRADREKVNEAIVAIVESMQREFRLSDD